MPLNYKIIGKCIKIYRKQRKLSQASLSEIIDKSPCYMSYLETGKKKPSIETLVDIANALQVSTDDLLSHNVLHRSKPNSEFGELLEDCNEYEKHIIIDTVKGLKQALRDERKQRTFYR